MSARSSRTAAPLPRRSRSTRTRSNDSEAGSRGVVGHAQLSQALSQIRGEHSFGANQPPQLQAASSSSDSNWNTTIGISAAAVALALSLVGLTAVAMRQRKPLHV